MTSDRFLNQANHENARLSDMPKRVRKTDALQMLFAEMPRGILEGQEETQVGTETQRSQGRSDGRQTQGVRTRQVQVRMLLIPRIGIGTAPCLLLSRRELRSDQERRRPARHHLQELP